MTSTQLQSSLQRYGPYTIRPAQMSDLARLEQLLLALQDHLERSNQDLWRMKPQTRGNLRGQIAGRLRTEDCCALVAEHDEDGVVGVIFGRIVTNTRYTPSRAGQIDQAFVCSEHRRTSVGSQLVAELCHFFAAQEVEDISLRYVRGNLEAAGFWRALGFTERIVTAGARRQTIEEMLHRSHEG